MRLIFVFICVFMISCSQKEQKNYVQTNEVPLAQPRVSATNTIIDSSVVVTADLGMKGVRIFYTNDRTEPTQESLLYTKPLNIQKQGEYRFKAFHPDWKPSEIVSLTLFEKGIIPDKIDWMTNASDSYPDEDLLSLINNKKGSLNFRDVEWAGFDSIAKATVNFEEKKFIEGMTVGYLIDTKSWIFPPKEVTIYTSKKDSIHLNILLKSKGELKKLDFIHIPINRETNFLTIKISAMNLPEWHPGKGNKAWLFLDEFIFNE